VYLVINENVIYAMMVLVTNSIVYFIVNTNLLLVLDRNVFQNTFTFTRI